MSKQGGDFDLLARVGKGKVSHAARTGSAGLEAALQATSTPEGEQ